MINLVRLVDMVTFSRGSHWTVLCYVDWRTMPLLELSASPLHLFVASLAVLPARRSGN